ncbi:MAG: hypothetical protein ABI668_06810 [Sphingorhabdus sp.]
MPIYCDESGGVGRGVMTLAAVSIEPGAADKVLAGFRAATGLGGELKGSRINLTERALVFKLLEDVAWIATVGVAISALKPEPNGDRGDHDIAVYAELLEDAIGSVMVSSASCPQVIIDDGRYGPATLSLVRRDIAELLGPCGIATLDLSHRLAGLQIADVIANSFFNRALVSARQSHMAAIVAPFLESGQIKMRILERDANK